MRECEWAERMLKEKIIPFWVNLEDRENGGFCGYVDEKTLERNWKGAKGSIYHARILWFMSEASLFFRSSDSLFSKRLEECADHAFFFIRDSFIDKEKGGVLWSLSFDGKALDTTKHTYAMAFAVYGLSSYYILKKDSSVYSLLFSLFSDLERFSWDGRGYIEAFSQDWEEISNDKLSENGVVASRTMNTLLHVIEAYANLYRATGKEEVGVKLSYLFNLYLEHIVDRKKRRLKVFMDDDYSSIINLWSYGHDVEASWLMDWASSVLGDKEIEEKVSLVSSMLAESVWTMGRKDGWLLNERENGRDDSTVNWWVQAEAVLGFMHHWRKSGEEKYREGALEILDNIDRYIVDSRNGGEWHSVILPGKIVGDRAQAEIWKSCYHNGRLCLELSKGGRRES